MSKEVQFERIAEPGRDAIIFNKYFGDRIVEVKRVHKKNISEIMESQTLRHNNRANNKKTQNFNGVPKGEEKDRALG